ncbi:hypothetical protein DPMN_041668 [Dreissena polymorpha]|uniref:Metalloendopeptidase n=1 Tax=Dreissena polymorpha TaxID=45954 RepID=A0A9D4HY39_DREPO|nr:hypothetical protein DPMN_041668 [Dreissena polymorpha]
MRDKVAKLTRTTQTTSDIHADNTEEVFSESEVDISEKNSNDDRNSGAAGNYDTNTDEGDDVQNDDTAGVEKPRVEIRVSVMKRSGRFWEPWELNNNVCPPSLCTSNDENVRPRGTGGSVFYNGDIVLDSESSKIIFSNDIMLPYRRKRATMRSSRTWIGGVVPYVFADDINPKSKRIINKAMKEIENKTCINFRSKKGKDSDYIRFISEPGCWSSVGKVGGEQKVSIGLGCERLGTAIHEISHALGFWHEQARPDRDGYVKILEENISPRYLPDFRKADPALVSSRGYPYDYESVMHYSERAFTNLGEKTIEVMSNNTR